MAEQEPCPEGVCRFIFLTQIENARRAYILFEHRSECSFISTLRLLASIFELGVPVGGQTKGSPLWSWRSGT